MGGRFAPPFYLTLPYYSSIIEDYQKDKYGIFLYKRISAIQ